MCQFSGGHVKAFTICKENILKLLRHAKENIISSHISSFLTMQVDYVPLSLMVTAFKKEDVKRPLEGFGVLIPYKEQQKHGLKTLGRLDQIVFILFLIWRSCFP
jgi:protoporphyrinogen oxidase